MDDGRDFRRGFWAEGVPFIWLSGFAALTLIAMVVGLTGLIFAKGGASFWPADMTLFRMQTGVGLLGPVVEEETVAVGGVESHRLQVKTGNREVTGLDFKWVNSSDVASMEKPADAAALRRAEYGDMHGWIVSINRGEEKTPSGAPGFEALVDARLAHVHALLGKAEEARKELERVRAPLAELEVEERRLIDGPDAETPETKLLLKDLAARLAALEAELGDKVARPQEEMDALDNEIGAWSLDMRLADGAESRVQLKNVLAVWRPNAMGVAAKTGFYLHRAWEFLSGSPRESNTEGGVFPAIFGTVLMVLIMAVAATPIGVMAALYMHEYATPGPFLNFVRLSVNNLAGVPSIVFGIFGLGFFIYFVGGGVDRLLFADKLPEPTFGTGGILWASLTLALLTVPVVIVASLEGLASVPRANRDGALALGATRFQTIWNVVLPNAMPGILTGLILAVSRAAGEVAPLMITGVVKLAAEMPVDAVWPFLHLDRKFMHLGFYIYDAGFQSPNVEAVKPMVYTTTGLLLFIVVALNLLAIGLRNRLRKKYKGAAL